MEEHIPTIWTIESALLGFVHLNNAHNSTRLGQALFKVIKQLDVMHKVCFSGSNQVQ